METKTKLLRQKWKDIKSLKECKLTAAIHARVLDEDWLMLRKYKRAHFGQTLIII